MEILDLLLQFGGDPTIKNKAGFTGLHIAARKGYTEIVKLLMAKGADPNIRDAHGFSASYWAKEFKHREIQELLPAPLKIGMEEFYEYMTQVWETNGYNPNKKKKKGGKKKKKKK